MMLKRTLIVLVVSLVAAACSDDGDNRRGPDEWDLNDDVSIDDDAGDVGDEVDGEDLDTDEPDADAPDADGPDADAPDADAPDADLPDADEPDADLPDADAPDADLPDADEPDADLPDADEPDVDPSAACVEIWSDGVLVGEDFDFGVQSAETTESFEIRLCEGAAPTRVDSLEVEGDAYTLAIGSVGGWPARIEDGRTLNFTVSFDPLQADLVGALVVGVIDAPGEFQFGLSGELRETSPECPAVTPQAAPSFTAVEAGNPAEATGGLFDLSVDGTYAESRFSVQWFVVETPTDATTPVFYDRSDEAPTRVHLEELGEYTIGLKLHDEQLDLACAPVLLPVEVIESPFGGNDAVVTLTWSNPSVPNPTPNVSGTDMDIHLCHPDGEFDMTSPWCVDYRQRTQTWHDGVVNIVLDDLWGDTGEVVSQKVALPGFLYKVGVHFFSDRGNGPTQAFVKLYQRGVLAHEQSRELISKQFWRPFDFEPGQGVTEVDSIQDNWPPPF